MKRLDDSIIEKMRNIFISIEVFNLRITPLEKIVYGIATVVGLAVVGAIIALVLKT
jgi:hypothetical protein